MTVTPRVLYTGGQIETTVGIAFTAAANVKTLITEWSLSNNGAAAAEVTIWLVRSGGSPTDANILIPLTAIEPDDQVVLPTGQLLNESDSIRWQCDVTASVTCAGINGYTIT